MTRTDHIISWVFNAILFGVLVFCIFTNRWPLATGFAMVLGLMLGVSVPRNEK